MLVRAIVSVVSDEDSEQSEPQCFYQTDPGCVREKHISISGLIHLLRCNARALLVLCCIVVSFTHAVAGAQCGSLDFRVFLCFRVFFASLCRALVFSSPTFSATLLQ